MARYHLKDNGEPGLCRAELGKCPKGGDHFDSKEDARIFYESLNEKKLKEVFLIPTSQSYLTASSFEELKHKIEDFIGLNEEELKAAKNVKDLNNLLKDNNELGSIESKKVPILPNEKIYVYDVSPYWNGFEWEKPEFHTFRTLKEKIENQFSEDLYDDEERKTALEKIKTAKDFSDLTKVIDEFDLELNLDLLEEVK